MRFLDKFSAGLLQDFKLFAFWCLVIMCFRIAFLAMFTEQGEGLYSVHLGEALWYGFRLSLKTSWCIVAVGALFSSVPAVFCKNWPAARLRFYVHGCAVVLFSVLFFARKEYYEIFHSGFNMMLVHGLYDDKKAIFATAVKEYNLFGNLAAAFFVSALLLIVLKRILREFSGSGKSVWMGRIIVPVFLPVFCVFVRYGGAFSYAASIDWQSAGRTPSRLLNEAILDDGQALYRVYSMKKKLDKSAAVDFSAAQLKGYIRAAAGNPQSADIENAFLRVVEQPKLPAQPEQIIVIVGESFGIWPMLPEFRDLGLTEKTLKIASAANAASVSNMLAHGTGTVNAVNGLVTGLPEACLHENYRSGQVYRTGIGYIMKQLGYKTVFWYGGFPGWQNIEKFTQEQNFDEFYSADDFQYDGGNAWGCEDMELFGQIEKYIASAKEKTFHVVLTTSNHPPYTVDVDRLGFPRRKVEEMLPTAIRRSERNLTELGHIWYADLAVGNFIDKVKSGKKDTLFVITGDHSERFTFAAEQNIKTLSGIPCIFYGEGVDKKWFAGNPGCHMQLAGTLAEMIAPAGFTYSSFLPSMFSAREVFNHRLTADFGGIYAGYKNEELKRKAESMRKIAAWRVIKGNDFEAGM